MKTRNGNSKTINFKHVYSQIAKYGKTISTIAVEYSLEEKAFIERMRIGLDPKLFSAALKANERNSKRQRNNKKTGYMETIPQTTNVNIQEEQTMANNEQTYSRNRSSSDKDALVQKKQASNRSIPVAEAISALESEKVTITGEISDITEKLDEASKILEIRDETVAKTQSVFDKAKKALNEAQIERDKARNAVTQYRQSIGKLKDSLESIDTRIFELKNNAIYLVAPGYTGIKPEFGTYYSTTEIHGYDTLKVVEATADCAIEPELKDMVVAGYDSYKEYMDGLRFVMLCMEYTCNDIEYTVLENDERLKKLLQIHVG